VLNNDGSVATRQVDNSTLLGSEPSNRTTRKHDGRAGRWMIKGLTTPFARTENQGAAVDRFKLSLGLGAAMAYVGTRYVVEEALDLTDVTSELHVTDESSRNVLMPAYFADADAEYWLTERTGLYLGATYQTSGDYGKRSAVVPRRSTWDRPTESRADSPCGSERSDRRGQLDCGAPRWRHETPLRLEEVSDPAVLRAMQTVPREEFVPNRCGTPHMTTGHCRLPADRPFRSQRRRLHDEKLGLNLATGSWRLHRLRLPGGVLAEVVREVYTVERIPELAETAKERLERLAMQMSE